MKCDFCSGQDPRWRYPARDFQAWEVDVLRGISTGAWAACDVCKDLLEKGDMEALLQRSYKTFMEVHEGFWLLEFTGQTDIKRELRHIHSLFLQNRTSIHPMELIRH